MPACPKENSTATSATWKEYRPRGPTSKGNGNQEDLVEVSGSPADLQKRLKYVYSLWLPHHWIKRWCEHQCQLTFATFAYDEACIMTDFSAVFDHKAWCSKCCEQAPTTGHRAPAPLRPAPPQPPHHRTTAPPRYRTTAPQHHLTTAPPSHGRPITPTWTSLWSRGHARWTGSARW